MNIKHKKLDKAVKALLGMGRVESGSEPVPTKKDLERKFVMRVGKDGKVKIKEKKQ